MGWSSHFLQVLRRAEQEGVRGWEKARTADCSHAVTGASCHGYRKALDLTGAGGRMHKCPRMARYAAHPGPML